MSHHHTVAVAPIEPVERCGRILEVAVEQVPDRALEQLVPVRIARVEQMLRAFLQQAPQRTLVTGDPAVAEGLFGLAARCRDLPNSEKSAFGARP